MAVPTLELIEARLALIERRLQLLGEEVSGALSDGTALVSHTAEGGERNTNFSGNISFDADSLSQFSLGFYQREYDQSGIPFRWTGSGPLCELRFFIDRGADRPFRMNAGITEEGILSQLKGFVDYAPVPLKIEKKGESRFVTGIIPKRAYTRLAVMTFLLGRPPPKKKKSKEADYQWLGFRFYSLKAGTRDAKKD